LKCAEQEQKFVPDLKTKKVVSKAFKFEAVGRVKEWTEDPAEVLREAQAETRMFWRAGVDVLTELPD
jgi:hypothetical protein